MVESEKTACVENCPTLNLIQNTYPELTKGQQRIADYVLSNPEDVVKCSISEFARKTGCKSEASIVRFYRSFGFSGYMDFKLKITQEIASRTFYHSYENINFHDSPYEIKRKIFSGAAQTLTANSSLDNECDYEKAVSLLMNSRRVILLGLAASAAICYYAQFRLLELGINSHFSPDMHINTVLLTNPSPGDLFFCISMSGETKDIIEPIQGLRNSDVSVLSITGNADSTLASLSDVVILTKTDEKSILTDSMNARISQMCTIDALFSMISISLGSEAFSRLIHTRKTFSTKRKPEIK